MGERKDDVIQIRVSTEEKKLIKKMAKKRKLNMTEYLKLAVLKLSSEDEKS
ncbi:plasmid mobilization protein [Clostridium sardiniense]|uniref:plasmid mobilization protein n=1 Tax=Clostridium sardiniense TaxID=29369 RepID=UPI00195B520C|nr:antitoxin [Clostridium sardiniense]MBM7836456.1 uncharacterized protein (DUF1778 family) [Clostridium sardiniense]